MQLAFNAVPQFLCIETGIEFNSAIPTVGATSSSSVKHNVTLFLAEDGNGKSVIVSAGISTLIGDDLTWLLDTFKSCNPAWRQVRCVVCDPTKCQQVVFKKEVKTKEPQQRNSFSKRTGQFQLSDRWRGKKQDEQPELDPDGRPRLKVALLCGPPGVGKTTLAHLLARLAGYRPVELNASDERSTEAFSTALKSATLMQSVLDADKRPNCLILDEIDGAPLATVELLVKWCTATTEGGKKKGKAQPLRRPVIAICNDQYATSLRPLRPVSLVLQVGGVSLHRLTSRLSRVAECEGLHAPPHVLAALAARAQGDVRAAIQVLSFIRAKAIAQLRMEDVENASIGTKDCSKSLMQALTALFTVNDKDPNAVLKTVQAAGEYDRLINIHRNAKSCGNKKQN